MKKASLIIVALVALGIGCAAGVAVREIVVPARAETSDGVVYEYTYVGMAEALGGRQNVTLENKIALLNRYGEQGWRLIELPPTGNLVLYFERSYVHGRGLSPAPSSAP